MKRKISHFSMLAGVGLLAFGVAGLSSCNSNFTAASIKLNVNSLEVEVGQSTQLRASVTKGYSGQVMWFTSNNSIADVDNGYVFGIGLGEATITAVYNGGSATCTVNVVPPGGQVDVVSLFVSPTNKTMKVGESFTLSVARKYPEDTTVTFSSGSPSVATVDPNSGEVTAVSAGTTVITAAGSNGKYATCSVTVREQDKDDGGDTGDDDIAVTQTGYTGSLTIGSPMIQMDFMNELLADFNRLTSSSVNFTVTKFEEDNGTSGYGTAASMPAVFPYASDQTLTLYQFGALSRVGKTDYNWIKDQMGQDAYDAAKLQSVVGYPFASDNGVVMFYNTDVVKNVSDIDTVDKLFALAAEKDYFINYAIGTGFYAAGILSTYSKGQSLYTLTPTDTAYTAEGNYNSATGLAGAKLAHKILNMPSAPTNAGDAPTTNKEVLATITDCSKVQNFKQEMGNKYAVAPLPWTDDNHTERIGSYLGYKFFGVNNQLDSASKDTASAVAKFLCSEYAQRKRFAKYNVRPTLTSLKNDPEIALEPHIAALNLQEQAKSTIPLTAVASELWSETATAISSIKTLGGSPSDAEFYSILKTLDSSLKR